MMNNNNVYVSQTDKKIQNWHNEYTYAHNRIQNIFRVVISGFYGCIRGFNREYYAYDIMLNLVLTCFIHITCMMSNCLFFFHCCNAFCLSLIIYLDYRLYYLLRRSPLHQPHKNNLHCLYHQRCSIVSMSGVVGLKIVTILITLLAISCCQLQLKLFCR